MGASQAPKVIKLVVCKGELGINDGRLRIADCRSQLVFIVVVRARRNAILLTITAFIKHI